MPNFLNISCQIKICFIQLDVHRLYCIAAIIYAILVRYRTLFIILTPGAFVFIRTTYSNYIYNVLWFATLEIARFLKLPRVDFDNY